VGDFQEVGEIGFTGVAELVAVALCGDIVGAAHQPGIIGGAIETELLEQLLETAIELAFRAVTVEVQREIGAGAHSQVYAEREREKRAGGEERAKRKRAADEPPS